MEVIKCRTWNTFLTRVRELIANPEALGTGTFSDLLFRGQANSKWGLETTLERRLDRKCSLAEYFHTISRAKAEIESRTGRSWDVPESDDFEKTHLEEPFLRKYPKPGDLYDYMVFLRHHGFPSPLLDWSQSPFVAAYFAYRHIVPDATHVSIFAYREFNGSSKVTGSGIPQIEQLGPFVRTHERHFAQQSQYTVCYDFDDELRHVYAKHSDVFENGRATQDKLWRFDIPILTRNEALLYLWRHNISAYTLFNSDDSLMESLSVREFDLRPSN